MAIRMSFRGQRPSETADARSQSNYGRQDFPFKADTPPKLSEILPYIKIAAARATQDGRHAQNLELSKRPLEASLVAFEGDPSELTGLVEEHWTKATPSSIRNQLKRFLASLPDRPGYAKLRAAAKRCDWNG